MSDFDSLKMVPPFIWGILVIVLLAQGIWVFNDAAKRGMNKWLWGLFGLLNTPTNLLVYLLVSRTLLGVHKCDECGRRYNQTFAYCPHCGHEQLRE